MPAALPGSLALVMRTGAFGGMSSRGRTRHRGNFVEASEGDVTAE